MLERRGQGLASRGAPDVSTEAPVTTRVPSGLNAALAPRAAPKPCQWARAVSGGGDGVRDGGDY